MRWWVDLPSILSGDYLGILDPHQQFFDGSGSHAWTLSRDGPSLLASARHQLDPYLGMFGCTEDTFSTSFYYPGTLFRFPLRTVPSPLSDTVCCIISYQIIFTYHENLLRRPSSVAQVARWRNAYDVRLMMERSRVWLPVGSLSSGYCYYLDGWLSTDR